MRTLWVLFSALVSAAAIAVYLGSPVDPLRWTADLVFGNGTLHLPAAGPVTRVADAALAGALVAYLLIFVPLSVGTWFDGSRQVRGFRAALDGSAEGVLGEPLASPAGGSPAGTASAWWPLLSLFSADAPVRVDLPGNGDVSKTGRTAIIDNLVANQSAASVFRDFPVIAIGLGLIALIGQLLPVLAADPGAIVAGSSSAALGSATARGFCSLVAATAAAAGFGLVSQLIGAIMRRRAESVCAAAALAVRQRRWTSIADDGEDAESAGLFVTPLPSGASARREGSDETVIEHEAASSATMPDRAGRQVAESVESALRDIQNSTLRPMLHDISRLLSLLGDRAGHLVETVDDRLRQHTEHTRQILAATEEITRALRALSEREAGAPGGGAPAADLAALQELRQTLADERASAAEVLRGIGQELTGQLDGALRTTARAVLKPVSTQTEAIRRSTERIDATTATMERVAGLIESSSGAIEQKLDRLVAVQESGQVSAAGSTAAGEQLREAAQEVAAIAGAARNALDAIAALSAQVNAERARLSQPGGWQDASPQGWAQRISALRQASIDLTSDLPALSTDAFSAPADAGADPASELAQERRELAALEAEAGAQNEKPAG